MHYKIKRIIRVALPALLLLIFALVAATALTERNAQSQPSAAQQDISAILEKDISGNRNDSFPRRPTTAASFPVFPWRKD